MHLTGKGLGALIQKTALIGAGILIGLSLIFKLWVAPAFAAVPQQNNFTATSTGFDTATPGYLKLGNGFTGLSNGVTLKGNCNNNGASPCTISVDLIYSTSSNYSNTHCADAGCVHKFAGTVPAGDFTVTSNASTTFNPNFYYALGLTSCTPVQMGCDLTSFSQIAITNGAGTPKTNFFYGAPSTIFSDFNLDGVTSTFTPYMDWHPASGTITFQTPSQNATTTDFPNWIVNTTFNSSDTLGWVKIKYDRFSSSSFTYTDQTIAVLENGIDSQIAIPKSQELIFPPLTNGTTWYARAELYNSSTTFNTSTLLATDQIQFQVSYPEAFSQPQGTSTLTATCDPNSGFFANSICNVLVYLFVPSQSSIQQLSSMGNFIGSKPPFGYYTALRNALSSVTSTPTTTTAVQFLTENPFYQALRNGITILLWLAFTIFLIKRFMHLEL